MITFPVTGYEHHVLSTFIFLKESSNMATMRFKEMGAISVSVSRGPEIPIMLHTNILKTCSLLAKTEIKNTAISENILERKR